LNKLILLFQLYDFYKNNLFEHNRFAFNRNDIKSEVINVAKQFNLYSPKTELLFNEVNHWFKDVEIIRYIDITTKTLPYVLKFLYQKKKKLNIEYYQRVLNTDPSIQLKFNFESNNESITKFNLTQKAIV